jgi:hypothetical protein
MSILFLIIPYLLEIENVTAYDLITVCLVTIMIV